MHLFSHISQSSLHTPHKRISRASVFLASSIFFASTASMATPVFAEPQPDPLSTKTNFAIQNITDFHGHFSETDKDPGAARLECALKREAAGLPAILTSSGDNIGASPFNSAILNDEPTIDVLNQLGVRASAVGNHEFDQGYKDLSDRVIPETDFSYMGANVTAQEALEPYSIEEVNGVRVAFIGSVTESTPGLVSPEGVAGLRFSDPVAATNKLADELADKADIIVALFHEGILGDEQWSKNIDIVFPGHTHKEIPPKPGDPVIVQAGQYGQAFAHVVVETSGDSFQFTPSLITADEIKTCDSLNPSIQATVSAAEAQAEVEGGKVVATTPYQWFRGVNRGVESQLNNLMAEVARESITKNTAVTADIGVMNAGGVRAELSTGDITYADAFSVQPFNNDITYTSLKGSDFKDTLEQQWKDSGERPLLSLGVSDNVTYSYDPQRPIGDRILSVTVDGKPLDLEKEYIVAGNSFLMQGGDDFEALTRGSELAQTGYIDVTGFIDYLQAHPDLTPRPGQSNISITPQGEFIKGQEVTVNIASLLYSQGDIARTATVTLGGKSRTVDINPEFGDPDLGEVGNAQVTLPYDGSESIEITTDAGTRITVPVASFSSFKDQQEDSRAAHTEARDEHTTFTSGGQGIYWVLAAVAALGVLIAAVGTVRSRSK